MKFGVIVFPGTWSERDCHHVITDVLGQDARYVWHKETDVEDLDCLVLPGGFSYGDYLRPGAIARFSPVMASVERFAAKGGLVIGICNGFQILCEAGLVPGALLRNQSLQFRCQWVNLRVERESAFTAICQPGQVLQVPISHGDGNYYCDAATLTEMEQNGQIIFRYCAPDGAITPEANPNGSLSNIAGVTNTQGNVLGMMPHPERCCEDLLGGSDGRLIFQSMLESAVGRVTAAR